MKVSDYVGRVRAITSAVHYSIRDTDSPAYAALKRMMLLTLPRDEPVSDETCRQAGLKFVAEALEIETDPINRNLLEAYRQVISWDGVPEWHVSAAGVTLIPMQEVFGE